MLQIRAVAGYLFGIRLQNQYGSAYLVEAFGQTRLLPRLEILIAWERKDLVVGTTFAFPTLLAATTARDTTQWCGWRQRAQECFAQLPNGAPGLRGVGKTVF